MNHFENSVSIVTGAASGIGRQLAVQLCQKDSYVIANDINDGGLSETKSLANGKIETHHLDVSKPDEIAAFAQEIVQRFKIEKLFIFNNAGVALSSGNFHETPIEDFEWLLNINLWGVVRMTKAFLPTMIKRNSGHIINISSVFGLAGIQQQSAYCTAKFGVRGFTESLRMELQDTNIGVTCVHPGGIKTNIARNSKMSGNRVTQEIFDEGIKNFDEIARTSAEEAAQQILNAVERRKTRLVIGIDGKLLDSVTRLFPTGYTKMIKGQMDKKLGDRFKINT